MSTDPNGRGTQTREARPDRQGQRDFRRNAGVSWHRKQATKDGGIRTHEVMRAEWVAARHLEAGVVVLAQIGYDDSRDFKSRPAIVLCRDRDGVHLIPCTSSSTARHSGCRELVDLQLAGLTKRTFVRRDHVVVERTAVVAILGRLGPDDAALMTANEVAA
jgi:hypothetical protein